MRMRYKGILIMLSVVVFSVLLLALGLWKDERYRNTCIILILGAALGGYSLIAPVTPSQMRERWSFTVRITQDTVHCTDVREQTVREIPIAKVKRVLDFETFYCVIYSDIGSCMICQKDLLTEGTAETFAQLFDGKIKKRAV